MAAQLGFAAALLLGARIYRAISRGYIQYRIMEEYRAVMEVPVQQAVIVRDALLQQLEIGLREKQSKHGLLMLPSYIDVLPTGAEQGDYFAIDLGGTNLRVLYVRLGHEKGATEAAFIKSWPIPSDCYNVDNGKLLDWVADCTIEVISKHQRRGADGCTEPPTIGFCFSFAVEQSGIDNGKLVRWTKSFRGKMLLGENVVAALKGSFAKKGVEVQIPVILNDTVSTLLSLRYSDPDTVMGIILGTGTNCAYLERIDRIRKLPASYRCSSEHMIINSEWGDFDDPSLPLIPEDVWIDCSSANPGHGRFEKMISGLYMGDLCQRLIRRLAEKGQLFGNHVPSSLTKNGVLSSADVSYIVEDSSANLQTVASCLANSFNIPHTSIYQRRKVQEVCLLITRRAARLCATAIAAILRHIGREDECKGVEKSVLAIDGSLFKNFSTFRKLLYEGLCDIYGSQKQAEKILLVLSEDGSVYGGAYIAAAVQRRLAQL